MDISVAICTHNGARFLAEQLESILDQTVMPGEIVLSDDASSDGTVELAETVVGGRATLRVLRNATPLGVTRNFQQALQATEGTLVILSDQDDVWRRDRVEAAAARFAARPKLTLLSSDARLVDEHGAPIGETLFGALEISDRELSELRGGRAFDAFLRRNLVTGATTMLRRSLVDAAAPFPAGWVHDEWLAIVAAVTGTVDVLEDTLIDYRQHGANQIGAARLGLRGKLGRLTEPGAARNRRLLKRAAALADRLPALPAALPGQIDAAHRKLGHERARSSLSVHRLARIPAVVRLARSGGYDEFGGGARDALRDLVQPLTPPPASAH